MAAEDFARHRAAELKNSAANGIDWPPREDLATMAWPPGA
jgi:hypothetical protein